ncbi:MAG TPA: hypothetical protein VJB59_03990 [Bdellovibrionota bacterium]|nr:hypothetical protein [Bdellovibrionota bacterium]
MRLLSWLLLFQLFLSTWQSFAAETDPLFAGMTGHWTAYGTRSFMISGRKFQVTSTTESRVENGILVSHNHWTEVPEELVNDPSAARHYERVYWIRAKKDCPGHYELGSGAEAIGPVAATGFYNSQTELFEVQQAMGPILMISKTQFAPGRSEYFETVWNGGTKISETTVSYGRSSGPLTR